MTDRRALAVLAVLHLAVVAIVQPRGDFPLNDDWAYAHSVQWFLAEGRIRLSEWVAMNLVPQTVAGALVTAAFGFSFETLRHLTQAIALAAMATVYGWFRVGGLAVLPALVATTAVAAFPPWAVLANSYMTDLYGLALAMAAAIFLARALENRSAWAIAWGCAFAIAGVLQRQVVLAIPFAFMVASLWTRRPLSWRDGLAAVVPFALCVIAEVLFQAYLAQGPGVPEAQRIAHGRLMPFLVNALTNERGATVWVASNGATMLGYLALFAGAWFAWWGFGGATRRERVAVVVGGVIIAAIAIALGWLPPYRAGNVIDRVGIGPLLLYDTTRGMAPLARDAGIFWMLLAIPVAFAMASLILLASRALVAVARRGADPVVVFCVAVLVAYLGPFAVTDYFDRYLLFALPFLLVLWSRLWTPTPQGRTRRALALAWIALAIALSAAATHDYFAWNRARWDAIRLAERLGASAFTLDGGFEYNGYRGFQPGKTPPEGKSWWWVQDDPYVVAFSRVPGYRVVETWAVRHWLPRSPAEIVLMRREP